MIYKVLQQQVQPRMLLFLLIALALMAAAASFLYVIKNPFQELRKQQQTLSLLTNETQMAMPLPIQIQQQQTLVNALNLKLSGTTPALSDNKMIPHIIGELDKISKRHQVNLTSVKPAASGILFTFRELPFKVEVTGNYLNLFAMIQDAEKTLGPIVIKQFELTPLGSGKQRKMALTIMVYQFEEK